MSKKYTCSLWEKYVLNFVSAKRRVKEERPRLQKMLLSCQYHISYNNIEHNTYYT